MISQSLRHPILNYSVSSQAIKFIEDPNAKAITSIDRGVLELKTTVERVEQQVEHIQSTISS
jgi:charged multivesicular body protein 7